MKIYSRILVVSMAVLFCAVLMGNKALAADTPGENCKPAQSILALPTWYKYLEGKRVNGKCVPQLGKCVFTGDATGSTTCFKRSGVDVGNIWLIGLALVEILLRLVGIAAVFIVILAGFKYMTSQGNPESTKSAKGTIVNAFIGIGIAIIGSVAVSFIADLLQR